MGINNLYKVIKSHCPDQLGSVDISELVGYKIAVDISIFLYKYVRSAGEPAWMNIFLLLLCTLKKYGIKAICIFDGPNPPIEKKKEQESRRSSLKEYTTRLKESIRLRGVLLADYCPTRIQPNEDMKKECKTLVSPRKSKDRTNYDDPGSIVQSLTLVIQRLEKQILPITKKHSDIAKDIVRMVGFACFQSDGEAETLCAYLACRGDVDAVLTEDTDVLAYGCPLMLAFKDFKLGDHRLYALRHDKIIEAMGLNKEEFLDLCILLKCDYNKHERDDIYGTVKGYPPGKIKRKKPVGIGEKGAWLMIQEWRTLEEVTKHIVNPELLKFPRCRELFTIPNEIPNVLVPYNKPLNTVRIKELILKNSLYISFSYIENLWKSIPIDFESDSD